MINLFKRVQGVSKNSNLLLSVMIIFIVSYLNVMTTPSIEIDTFISRDKVAHIVIFILLACIYFLLSNEIAYSA